LTGALHTFTSMKPTTRPEGSIAQERCRASFTIQDANPEEGVFRGLASVVNTLIDTWIPTRILPGAFKDTLADEAQRRRVKVLYQHSEFEPIGIPIRMDETAAGLDVEAKVSQTTRGKDTLILMRDKVITDISIGFDPLEWTMVRDAAKPDYVERHISKLRLWEFSPVTFGANRDATILSVNSLADVHGLRTEFLAELRPLIDVLEIASNAPRSMNIAQLTDLVLETHVGKVLSTKNQSLVQAAVDALSKLLEAAKAAAKPDDDSEVESIVINPDTLSAMRELDLMSHELVAHRL
jgi:HK97 family phage prohead protease